MTLYSIDAYDPRITYGSTFYFDAGTTRINILEITTNRTYRTQAYEVPGKDGTLIVGKPRPNGIEINLSLEIATVSLSTYITRREALLTALRGNADGKSTFYLRYLDANNYYAFTNCVLTAYAFAEGPHDPKNPDGVSTVTGSVTLLSQDVEPTIVNLGEVSDPDTTVTHEDYEHSGSLALVVSSQLAVQTSAGAIIFRVSADTAQITIAGTVTSDDTTFVGTLSGADADAEQLEASTWLIEGEITIQNSLGETLAVISADTPGIDVTGNVSQTL